VQHCGSVHQCVAVRAAVCGSVWQSVAVRAAVCGSVWQCQCGTAHGSVRTVHAVRVVRAVRAAVSAVRLDVYGSAAVCVRQCGSVRQCVAVPGVVCSSACGSVWQCAAVHTAVCGNTLCIYVHMYAKSLTIYLLVCPCTRSNGTELHIPCISIITYQYVLMRINAN
jgi:hypothetical protein